MSRGVIIGGESFATENIRTHFASSYSEIQKMQSLLESEGEGGDEIQTFVIASQKKKMSQFQR